MIVLLMATRRSLTPAFVKRSRDILGTGADVQLRMVSLTAPKRNLQLDEHIVVGASIRPFRSARRVPVASVARTAEAPAPIATSPPAKAGFAGRAVRKAWRVLRRQLSRVPSHRLAGLLPGDATRFLVGAATSRSVRKQFAAADLVIAMDPEACRAAWVLAKATPHPEVVYRVEGGAKALGRRKTEIGG